MNSQRCISANVNGSFNECTVFSTRRDIFDHIKDSLHDSLFEIKAAFVSQNTSKEAEHNHLFTRKFQTQVPNCLDDGDFELVRYTPHEPTYFLHQSIHRRLISSLEQSSDSVGGDRAIGIRDKCFDIRIE